MAVTSTPADQASAWLRPGQVERLRTTCYDNCFQPAFQQRNEAIITLLYDSGLRVGELVELTRDMLDLDAGELKLSRTVQLDTKTQSTKASSANTLDLDPEHSIGTVRVLKSYLYNRTFDSPVLFPSRKGGQLTPKAVRDVVSKTTEAAGVRPYTPDGRGDPADVSPKTLRHSTAWRLLNVQDRSLIDVRDRLRHTTLSTTKYLYADFETQERSINHLHTNPSSTPQTEQTIRDDVLDAIPDILYVFDRNGQMIGWNDSVVERTRYTDAEIADMHPLEFIANEDREEIAEAIARVLDQETIETRESHLVTKAGDYLPYEFTVAPITDDEGKVWAVAGVGRDITVRKRFERVSDAMYALDTDWRFTYLNEQAEELVGRSEAELLGTEVWEEFPEAANMEIYDSFQMALETQEPVTFETYYPPLETWFSVRAYPSKTGLSVYFRDITDREEREQELAQQNQITALVQEIIHALVEEPTRSKIEQTVCNRLAESEFYRAVWIGDYHRTVQDGAPRARAGINEDTVATITGTRTEEGPSRGIATRAVETRQPQVVQSVADAPAFDACHELMQAQGINSAMAIPIAYNETLYGVLAVYAEDPNAFDGRQQTLFTDLGDTIGHAIAAVEQKETLVTDNVLELEFDIQDSEQFFIQATTQTNTTVTLEGVAGSDGSYLEYFTVTNAAPAEFLDLADQTRGVDHVRLVSRDSNECLCEVGVTSPSIVTAVANAGGTVTALTAEDGFGTVIVELSRTADIHHVVDALDATVADVDLLAKRTVDRPVQTEQRFRSAVSERLTTKQRDVLEAAHFAGFFEQPRRSRGDEIAESLGISPSTFHQHMRAGLRKFIDVVVADSRDERA